MINIEKAKPILFSTPMVQAILAGHKTMTRRVINPQPTYDPQSDRWVWPIPKSKVHKGCCTEVCTASREWWEYLLPDQLPYKPGDILWVRETWAQTWTPDSNNIGFVYKADGKPAAFPYWGNLKQCKDEAWISSIFMPRKAARIFLKVTNIKVERLQDMNFYDWKADFCPDYTEQEKALATFTGNEYMKQSMKRFWDSLNAKRGYGWDTNPWVWVISFERINSGGI